MDPPVPSRNPTGSNSPSSLFLSITGSRANARAGPKVRTAEWARASQEIRGAEEPVPCCDHSMNNDRQVVFAAAPKFCH